MAQFQVFDKIRVSFATMTITMITRQSSKYARVLSRESGQCNIERGVNNMFFNDKICCIREDLLYLRGAENPDFSLLIAQLFGRTDVRMAGTRLLKVIDSHPFARLSLFPTPRSKQRAPVDNPPPLPVNNVLKLVFPCVLKIGWDVYFYGRRPLDTKTTTAIILYK